MLITFGLHFNENVQLKPHNCFSIENIPHFVSCSECILHFVSYSECIPHFVSYSECIPQNFQNCPVIKKKGHYGFKVYPYPNILIHLVNWTTYMLPYRSKKAFIFLKFKSI
jgi:hypothetical protein